MAVSIYIPTNRARGFLFSTLAPAFILLLFKFILYLYILKMQLLEKFKWHKGLTYFSFKKFIIIIFLEAQYFYQAKRIWHIVFILYARHFSLRFTPISSFKPFPNWTEVQRGGVTCLRSHSKNWQWVGWGVFELCGLAPKVNSQLLHSIDIIFLSNTCVFVCVCGGASLVDQW